ncbi:MAG: hypothetical protein J6U03_04475, partial [Muribaculaceae bacterium]|nr:hypothetical protein [Muribaculaceae bacterium]
MKKNYFAALIMSFVVPILAFAGGPRIDPVNSVKNIDKVCDEAAAAFKAAQEKNGKLVTINRYEPAFDGNDEYAFIEKITALYTQSEKGLRLTYAVVDLNDHGSLYEEEYVYDNLGKNKLIRANISHIEYGNPPGEENTFYYMNGELVIVKGSDDYARKPDDAMKRSEAIRSMVES